MNEILCKKCGNPLAEDDGGRYYAHVCKDCCEKHDLCRDCGHPVILTPEQSINFACSGWHTTEGIYLIGMKDIICPECGHKFRA